MASTNHIYVDRIGFVHHGIDIGDGTVIHYDGREIVEISIDTFCNGKKYLIKHYANYDPDSIVVKRAKSRLGESKYNLLFNNCEHFARWCKTGQQESEQVKNAGVAVSGTTASGAAVAGSIGIVSAIGVEVGLSGAGVMSGLASVGGSVGGGAVVGVGILGAVPGIIAKVAMDQVLQDDKNLTLDERHARGAGRHMTTVGAVAGSASAIGAIAACGSVAGLSAAGITSGLAAIGGVVGGGMAAGVVMTVAAPAVAATAIGYGAYAVWSLFSPKECCTPNKPIDPKLSILIKYSKGKSNPAK
jgi:Lecithin retinol acyltransferase